MDPSPYHVSLARLKDPLRSVRQRIELAVFDHDIPPGILHGACLDLVELRLFRLLQELPVEPSTARRQCRALLTTLRNWLEGRSTELPDRQLREHVKDVTDLFSAQARLFSQFLALGTAVTRLHRSGEELQHVIGLLGLVSRTQPGEGALSIGRSVLFSFNSYAREDERKLVLASITDAMEHLHVERAALVRILGARGTISEARLVREQARLEEGLFS